MSLLGACDHPGCGLLTLGDRCTTHAARPSRSDFPRGRPFQPASSKPMAPQPDVTNGAIVVEWPEFASVLV